MKSLGDPGDILYFLFGVGHDAEVSIDSSGFKADSGADSQFTRQHKVVMVLNINLLVLLTPRINVVLNNRNINKELPSSRVGCVVLTLIEAS